ncbi:MAG: GNAT family N-acetyltransferase [Gemmatimonadota bacterium]|nr:GNAT family N-acetyltransferase [Gemmatimonadota bacterium]
MAITRSWRAAHHADGPYPARAEDIPALNTVFSDAFTDRYRRDGLVGVSVPFLSPGIWRYAIEDADAGALLWRDERDEILAFNMVHASGAEGWMGPLAVRPDRQAGGLGKTVVRAGIDWLKHKGARTIGLETMPRTMDNIGFYSALGFAPGRLTITVTLDATIGDGAPYLLGRLGVREKAAALRACRDLAEGLLPGYDFTREIAITDRLAVGDTVLLWHGGKITGFALCHTVPLVEGRAREEIRVLKLVLARRDDLGLMARTLTDYARRMSAQRVALRVQTEYADAYARLIALGGRVRWTDLRMTLAGYAEPTAAHGLVLSNWEI